MSLTPLTAPRRRVSIAAVAGALLLAAAPATAETTVETILILRHGEKPAAGLGQLSCRGLARSLALAATFETRFGRPDAIFAPNPSVTKDDGGVAYAYVRPLATIEPTAIRFGLPVDTRFGWTDLDGLERALVAPDRARSRIVVAWEHAEAEKLTKRLLKHFGADSSVVPKWRGSEFDRVHVLTLTRAEGKAPTLAFALADEGLDGLPDACPDR